MEWGLDDSDEEVYDAGDSYNERNFEYHDDNYDNFDSNYLGDSDSYDDYTGFAAYSPEPDNSSADLITKAVKEYEKLMEHNLETVFVFENFLLKEKNCRAETNQELKKLFANEQEEKKHSTELETKFNVKKAAFESKFLVKQTNKCNFGKIPTSVEQIQRNHVAKLK